MSNIGFIRDVFSTEQIKELLSKYMSVEMLGGPHGTKHALRTMLIASKILAQFPQADPTVVLCASTFHDVGRRDDGADPLHGFRGVPRVLAIMQEIRDPYHPLLYGNARKSCAEWDVVKGKVADIVANHCLLVLPTGLVGLEAQVATDADKLDLLRGGPDNLDPSRLALSVSKDLIPWVVELVGEYR